MLSLINSISIEAITIMLVIGVLIIVGVAAFTLQWCNSHDQIDVTHLEDEKMRIERISEWSNL